MSIKIRAVIHFLYLKNLQRAFICNKIKTVYETYIISLRTIQKWPKLFANGKFYPEDAPRSGRLTTPDPAETTFRLLSDNPFYPRINFSPSEVR